MSAFLPELCPACQARVGEQQGGELQAVQPAEGSRVPVLSATGFLGAMLFAACKALKGEGGENNNLLMKSTMWDLSCPREVGSAFAHLLLVLWELKAVVLLADMSSS